MKDRARAMNFELAQIVSLLEKELPQILADQPVMLAYLFGSVVDQLTTAYSDVDIALIFDPSYNESGYERMQIEFAIAEEIEKSRLIPEADVRSIDRAPLMVQGSVLTNGMLVYSRDEGFRVDYEVSVRKKYFDFLPTQEMMQKSFFQHVLKDGLVNGKA
jgi:uncharacterized protein